MASDMTIVNSYMHYNIAKDTILRAEIRMQGQNVMYWSLPGDTMSSQRISYTESGKPLIEEWGAHPSTAVSYENDPILDRELRTKKRIYRE